jgi:dihydroorotase (multifunctional complex type)
MHDLRILNATVVGDGAVRVADIGIESGTIAEVAAQGSLGPGRRDLDASGLHAMPGAVDVHFHCRAPSRPERGDFASETAAAAAGGVTTVFEMPISDPACSTPDVFLARRALIEAQAHVNVALYAGAAVEPARAEAMAALGAIAFKLFTLAPAPGREREFDGLWAATDADIYGALSSVAETDLRCVVHAESDSLLALLHAQSDGAGRRPPAVEAVGIVSAAALAKEAAAAIHIAHVSSRSALEAVRAGLALGAELTAETCPQYLLLDERTVERFGGLAKIAPPLREPQDRDALWAAIADGTIVAVASDHSPFLPHEKLDVDFAAAPQGLPTVELLVPTMLDAAARGVLSLERAVELVTSSPARLFGLDRKGTLSVGADADITLFGLTAPTHPKAQQFHTRARGCAVVFEPLELRARIEQTIVGGAVVFRDGAIVDEQRGRRFVAGPRASVPEPEPV